MGKKVEIPDDMYELFEERAPEKGLDSAEEYVNYVLGQIQDKLEGQEESDEQTYTEEEEKKVKNRLKDLGYMD